MPEQEKTDRRQGGIKPTVLVGAGAIAIVTALVSGTYLAKTVYEPQVAIVAALEAKAHAEPKNVVDFYEDKRAAAFYDDPFFYSKTWSDYMVIADRYASIEKNNELEVFDAQIDGVWIPELKSRAKEAKAEYAAREDNDEFMHFMLTTTATTLACDASEEEHVDGVDADGQSLEEEHHEEEDLKASQQATRDFIANWSFEEEPMKYVIEPYLPNLTEEEKPVVKEAFTEAMEAGLPYFCPKLAMQ